MPQIYIIKDADKMNVAAQNSLLKFLEEPNPNHFAFLTTSNYKKLLDTIVSRCQFIHFKPIPKKYLMEKLIDYGVEVDISYIVSHLTSEVDVAMKYIEEGKITNMMNIAKKIVDKDLKKKDSYIEYFRNKVLIAKSKEYREYEESSEKRKERAINEINKRLNSEMTDEEKYKTYETRNIQIIITLSLIHI